MEKIFGKNYKLYLEGGGTTQEGTSWCGQQEWGAVHGRFWWKSKTRVLRVPVPSEACVT